MSLVGRAVVPPTNIAATRTDDWRWERRARDATSRDHAYQARQANCVETKNRNKPEADSSMALDEKVRSHRTSTPSPSGHAKTRARKLLACAPVLFLGASLFAQPAEAASASAPLPNGVHANYGVGGEVDINACPDPKAGHVSGMSRVQIDHAAHTAKPMGLGGAVTQTTIGDDGADSPAYLQSAYNLPSTTTGVGETVTIVDAYDDPNAESDLAAYRTHYGLSPCTTANGCFRKVDEQGGTAYPAPDGGWAMEISLDVDMVSAICPNCHILLLEATTSIFSDMGVAEDEAVSLGADVVSNSFDGSQFYAEASYDVYFDHPGVPITVASGDSGWGGSGNDYPAASPYVTAVGGTSLYQASNTGTRDATETAWGAGPCVALPGVEPPASCENWAGSGSGCSAYEPKPSWQSDQGCPMRTTADVSAVADPATPVWAYDTYPDNGATYTWAEVGGTSAAAPIVAGVYALAGGRRSPSFTPADYPYAQPGALNDVTSGSNGSTNYECDDSFDGNEPYLCTAGPGYDGPTGLGTPNGIGAFEPSAPSAPQHLAAGSSSATTVLSWAAPLNNGGTPVTAYRIYRADQDSVPLASVGPATTTYRDTGLVDGTTYTYTVTAVTAIGEGAGSSVSTTPDPLDHLVLSPANAAITVGASQVYTVEGFDNTGGSLGDETAATTFSVAPDGSCAGSSCTTAIDGDHTLTGTLAGERSSTTLHVNPGPLDHLALTPADATVPLGGSQPYTSQGFDVFGDSLGDLTANAILAIAPDGSCVGSTCTAVASGDHAVTGYAVTPTTLVTVATADRNACGLTAVGGVRCWGRNDNGELGDGAYSDSSNDPVAVSGLTSGLISVSIGQGHACALTNAGGVTCWGEDGFGQLGDGNTNTRSATPVAVTGLSSGATAVSVGDDHTCALTSVGGAECWGLNEFGQLGNGVFQNGYFDSLFRTPGDVSGLTSGVAAISAGNQHTCALTTSGGVKCWGWNNHGQLGNGTTTDSNVPVDVIGLTRGVVAISAGTYDTCALTAAGGVECWGDNWAGQLGDGTITDSDVPVAVAGLTGVETISVGGSTACAVTNTTGLKCWGSSQYGQLGNGTQSNSAFPVDVSGLTTGVEGVSTNLRTCAAVIGSGVECWGWVADSPTTHYGINSFTPIAVSGSDYATAASTLHAVGLPGAPSIGTASGGDGQATVS